MTNETGPRVVTKEMTHKQVTSFLGMMYFTDDDIRRTLAYASANPAMLYQWIELGTWLKVQAIVNNSGTVKYRVQL